MHSILLIPFELSASGSLLSSIDHRRLKKKENPSSSASTRTLHIDAREDHGYEEAVSKRERESVCVRGRRQLRDNVSEYVHNQRIQDAHTIGFANSCMCAPIRLKRPYACGLAVRNARRETDMAGEACEEQIGITNSPL